MATLKIEIPDAIEQRAIRAISDYYGYIPMLQKKDDKGAPYEEQNPETRRQFVARVITENLQEILVNYEHTLEQAQAREAKKQQIKDQFQQTPK